MPPGDGIYDVMNVNGDGSIHAFISGEGVKNLQGGNYGAFPANGAPYNEVLLADMNGGQSIVSV